MSVRNGNPKMQRAHFQLIANVVADFDFQQEEHLREALAVAFAKRLRACNPQFNWDRFIEAATRDSE